MNTKTIIRIRYAEANNKSAFYLQKVPILKKVIPYNLREFGWFKVITGILQFIKFIAWPVLKTMFIFFIISLIDILVTLGAQTKGGVVILAAVLVMGWFRLLKPVLLENNALKWTVLRIFKANAKEYYLSSLALEFAQEVISTLVIFVYAYNISSHDSFLALSCAGIYIAIFTIREVIALFYYKKSDEVRSTLYINVSMTLFYFLFACAVFSLYYFMTSTIPFIVLSFLLLVIALYGLRKLQSYNDYFEVFKQQKIAAHIATDTDNASLELAEEELRIDDHLTLHELDDKYSGYNLLNQTFFQRHQRIWKNPIRFRLISFTLVLSLLLFVGIVIQQFFPDAAATFRQTSNENYVGIISIIFFILNIGNVSLNLTRSYFLNCDRYLLNYAFYRHKDVVWKQYLSRMKYNVVLNLIPSIIIILFLCLYQILNITAFDALVLLEMILMIFTFTVLLGLTHLFLYYILQPFNEKLEARSVPYNIAIMFLFILSYNVDDFYQIPYFPQVLVGFTLVFILISTLIVKQIAYRTFKLK